MFISLEVGQDGIDSMQINIRGDQTHINKFDLPIASLITDRKDSTIQFKVRSAPSRFSQMYWIQVTFDNKDSLSKWIEKYNYDKLFNTQNEVKEMKEDIRELKEKVQELIDMIKYLPHVGPGYHEAKNDFQKQCANKRSRIDS